MLNSAPPVCYFKIETRDKFVNHVNNNSQSMYVWMYVCMYECMLPIAAGKPVTF